LIKRYIHFAEPDGSPSPQYMLRQEALRLAVRLHADEFTWSRYPPSAVVPVWKALAVHRRLDPGLIDLDLPDQLDRLREYAALLRKHDALPSFLRNLQDIRKVIKAKRLSVELDAGADPIHGRICRRDFAEFVARWTRDKPRANPFEAKYVPLLIPRLVWRSTPRLNDLLDANDLFYVCEELRGFSDEEPENRDVHAWLVERRGWKDSPAEAAATILRPPEELSGGRPRSSPKNPWEVSVRLPKSRRID